MTKAIFPGSFDPITNGHVKMAIKASQMFDDLYFVIVTNTKKRYLFSPEERVELAAECFKDYPNIHVINKTASLTVNVARELGAKFIVRGLRNETDFSFEREIAAINKTQAPELETVFLLAEPNDSFISSSMIKEVVAFGGNVDQLVPKNVAQGLRTKYDTKHE